MMMKGMATEENRLHCRPQCLPAATLIPQAAVTMKSRCGLNRRQATSHAQYQSLKCDTTMAPAMEVGLDMECYKETKRHRDKIISRVAEATIFRQKQTTTSSN